MWYIAELVLKNYSPTNLEKGMLFFDDLEGDVFPLDIIPVDVEGFTKAYGMPVELFIIDSMDNTLAKPTELGWVAKDDELQPLTLDDVNFILNMFGGVVEIDVDDDDDNIIKTPKFVEEKVTIKYPF